MIELLFYASLTCAQAGDIIDRIGEYEGDRLMVEEVIETVKDSTPSCSWDAND